MMEKNVLTIRVPQRLKEQLQRQAKEQGVSLNQLAVYAFSKEVNTLEAAAFFERRKEGLDRDAVIAAGRRVLEKVRNREPLDETDFPEGTPTAGMG